MLEALKAPEFWMMLAVVAVLIVGMEALEKYLKKISSKCNKNTKPEERKD